jgi:hypothetical protein
MHIAIVAMGPSSAEYLDLAKKAGGRSAFADKVFAINAMGGVIDCDMVFHMDDIRIQEIRAEARPQSNIANMVKWIAKSKTPVMTSIADPEYPALVEFPLQDVLNSLGYGYFNNTAAYAVAYAIHIGATKISLFGMDYTYENAHHSEKGRGCVEYWIGQANARGVEICLPHSTSLMDSCEGQVFYGYDCVNVSIAVGDDGLAKCEFSPVDKMPTADEIEANYDHSKPPSQQHKSLK